MPRIRLKDGAGDLTFVDWQNEPKHTLRFENGFTRIYEARFAGGAAASTLFHRHQQDTVYACVSGPGPGGSIASQAVSLPPGSDPLADEYCGAELAEPVAVAARPGWCFCMLHRESVYVHRVQTPDGNANEVRFVGCEVLAPPPLAAPAPLAAPPAYALELSEARFRGYRLSLAPGQSTGPHSWAFCGVMIVLTDCDQLAASPGSPFHGRGEQPAAGGAAAGRGLLACQPLRAGDAWWFEGPAAGHEVALAPLAEAEGQAAGVLGAAAGEGAGAAFEALIVEWLAWPAGGAGKPQP